MATITLRVEDAVRDALDAKARAEGVTISEILRDLIVEAVVPARETRASREDYAPESMTHRDRHMFAMLHRILARVLPDDASDVDGDLEYQLERALVLERGYTAEYGTEFAGVYAELSARDCTRVMDILDMYRMLDHSLRELRSAGVEIDPELAENLRYDGLDFNDELEGRMADYVKYLLSHGKWEERAADIARADNGNSHLPMLATYVRMLNVYRQIMDSRPPMARWRDPLALKDLQSIVDAQTHPANRNS